jgi:ribonuclease E
MQLSRERLSPPLYEKSHVLCPCCEGAGMIRSVESSSLMALRKIHLYLNRNRSARIRVGLPRDVALYLFNQQRKHLVRLEQEFSTEIHIMHLESLRHGEVSIETLPTE